MWAFWVVICAIASFIAYLGGYRAGREEGRMDGYLEGWRRREAYGNGGKRQWQNKPPGKIKGEPRGRWWSYR